MIYADFVKQLLKQLQIKPRKVLQKDMIPCKTMTIFFVLHIYSRAQIQGLLRVLCTDSCTVFTNYPKSRTSKFKGFTRLCKWTMLCKMQRNLIVEIMGSMGMKVYPGPDYGFYKVNWLTRFKPFNSQAF